MAYCPPVILASIRFASSSPTISQKDKRSRVLGFSLASIPDHGDLSDVEMDDGTAFDIPGLDRL